MDVAQPAGRLSEHITYQRLIETLQRMRDDILRSTSSTKVSFNIIPD